MCSPAGAFAVTVDYGVRLPAMIGAGRFDRVSSDITEENFPPIRGESQKVAFTLVHFNRTISSDIALANLSKVGLRPANLQELLAFAEKHPCKQRNRRIIALGSVWRLPEGGRYVPTLCFGSGSLFSPRVRGRNLSLDWFGLGWHPDSRFLAAHRNGTTLEIRKR